MNFSSSNYHPFAAGKGTLTTSAAEVAENTKNIMNYSTRTRLRNYSTVYMWSVKGVNELGEETTRIESPSFTHQNSSKWCMVVTGNSDGLDLSLLHISSGLGTHVRANVKIHQILPSGEKREIFSGSCHLKEGEETKSIPIEYENVDDTEGNAQDEITFQCEVCIKCVIHEELPVAEPQGGMVRVLDEMLHKEVHTDFELHTGGTVVRAHRAMLSMQSPYFAALLQPDSKESQDGFVQVSDVKPEVLKQILAYMYTGAAPALKDSPWELLIAADKYQLKELKRQCEAHLANCLDVDNAAETAANASLYSCDMLWERAVRFIKDNLNQVMSSSGWAETIVSDPKVIQRISELMA